MFVVRLEIDKLCSLLRYKGYFFNSWQNFVTILIAISSALSSLLPYLGKSDSLSNCLTPLYLKKENAYEIYLYLKEKYNIVLCPSGGNLKNKLLRVGHIGNLNKDNVDALLKALKNMKDEGILWEL